MGFMCIPAVHPSPNDGNIDLHISRLSDLVDSNGGLDENAYFIGQSIGCQLIMRYLSQQSSNICIGGLIAIGGWFNIDNPSFGDAIEPWCDTSSIDFARLQSVAVKIMCFGSSNDTIIGLPDGENERQWKKLLPAVQFVKCGERGHFLAEFLTDNELGLIDEFLGVVL